MIVKQTIVPFKVPPVVYPRSLTPQEKKDKLAALAKLLQRRGAVIIAHYYTPPEIQELADLTDGFVGDSLAMARFGMQQKISTLLVCGVKFMAETAKILNPNKTILIPSFQADCSLDLSCPAESFKRFRNEHRERVCVVYVNTSAAVKACADWTVTSSNALAIVNHLTAEGEKILWAPDRYLGDYIQRETNADMLIWPGSCVVHEKFKADAIRTLQQQYPNSALLVHPESPAEVIAMADVVGSTSRLLKAAKELPHATLIVATDKGLFYKMHQAAPDKLLLEAPSRGVGGDCKSCARCPWMLLNNLDRVEQALLDESSAVTLDQHIITRARIPLMRMIDFVE